MKNIDRAFTSYDVQQSFFDTARVDIFRRAIQRTVQPGDVVVDGGAGSGLLGLFAAQFGASRVYFVEANHEFIPVIQENARRNGFVDRIVVLHADACTVDLPESVDVIISEVMCVGFFYEPQLEIMRNLRRFLRRSGKIIPHSVETSVALASAQDTIYGLRFAYDARQLDLEGDITLTDHKPYLHVTYVQDVPHSINAVTKVTANRSGVANAARVSYRLEMTPGTWEGVQTTFLLSPIYLFLEDHIPVEAGKSYAISLQYEPGVAPLASKVAAIEVSAQIDRNVQRVSEPGEAGLCVEQEQNGVRLA